MTVLVKGLNKKSGFPDLVILLQVPRQDQWLALTTSDLALYCSHGLVYRKMTEMSMLNRKKKKTIHIYFFRILTKAKVILH